MARAIESKKPKWTAIDLLWTFQVFAPTIIAMENILDVYMFSKWNNLYNWLLKMEI